MQAKTLRSSTHRYLSGLLLLVLIMLGVGASATNALAGVPAGVPVAGGAGPGVGHSAAPPPLAPPPVASDHSAPAAPSAPNVTCGPVSFAPQVLYTAGANPYSAVAGGFNRDGKL